jgi:hypothetical protein
VDARDGVLSNNGLERGQCRRSVPFACHFANYLAHLFARSLAYRCPLQPDEPQGTRSSRLISSGLPDVNSPSATIIRKKRCIPGSVVYDLNVQSDIFLRAGCLLSILFPTGERQHPTAREVDEPPRVHCSLQSSTSLPFISKQTTTALNMPRSTNDQ